MHMSVDLVRGSYKQSSARNKLLDKRDLILPPTPCLQTHERRSKDMMSCCWLLQTWLLQSLPGCGRYSPMIRKHLPGAPRCRPSLGATARFHRLGPASGPANFRPIVLIAILRILLVKFFIPEKDFLPFRLVELHRICANVVILMALSSEIISSRHCRLDRTHAVVRH